MADDDDHELLVEVAKDFIRRLGAAAVDELNEQAEIAAGVGDDESARTWRDIAEVAQNLLN
jgi:hypothetical protein